MLQPLKGARNKIAGAVAHNLVRRGRTFEDFQRWDTANEPSLASDEPAALRRWWDWALERERPVSGNLRSGVATK